MWRWEIWEIIQTITTAITTQKKIHKIQEINNLRTTKTLRTILLIKITRKIVANSWIYQIMLSDSKKFGKHYSFALFLQRFLLYSSFYSTVTDLDKLLRLPILKLIWKQIFIKKYSFYTKSIDIYFCLIYYIHNDVFYI